MELRLSAPLIHVSLLEDRRGAYHDGEEDGLPRAGLEDDALALSLRIKIHCCSVLL